MGPSSHYVKHSKLECIPILIDQYNYEMLFKCVKQTGEEDQTVGRNELPFLKK